MSKLRVWGTLATLVLFAAVAVFPNVGHASTSTKATQKATVSEFRDTGVLMADGTDPWPPPPPIPWQSAVA